MSGVEPAVALSFAQELIAQRDQLSRRVAELEGALRDAREYLMNSPYRASDTSGKEWNRVMDVSGAALKGQG